METEILDHLIAQMVERRKELKLTQRTLAEKCGLPHSSIARMESGANRPNLVTLAKILAVLGVSLKLEATEHADVG